MKQQIKKYVVLNIVAKLVSILIVTILIIIFPKLLTFEFPNGSIQTFSPSYLTTLISYLFNIIIATFIFRDMRKHNLNSIAMLLLTCFSAVLGTIIFLIVSFQNQLPKYEKQTT